ncbi:glycosyltransferase family 4 protein [candidate division KSB1 bacterium]|nr:glycosyltransferase family 4 protein [candidate division KSB1 bacterium]
MHKKSNILLAGPFPPPNGGVAAINRIIVEGLKDSAYRIQLLDASKHKRKLNIRSTTGIMNHFFQLVEVLEFGFMLVRHNCRIIHLSLSSFHSFYKGALYVLLSTVLRRSIVIHLHGGAFKTFYENGSSRLKACIRWVFKQADFVLVLSGYWEQFVIRALGVEPQKSIILYNCYGIDFEQLDSSNPACIAREQRTISILYIGALGAKKGVLDLIRICSLLKTKLDDFRMLIAGGEKDRGIRRKLENAIVEQGLENHVKLLGEIRGAKKLEIFRKSDIFILPSYVENSPVSILEAMRAGLPVLSTPVGAIPEIVVDGENGFIIEPGDAAAFAEKIVLLAIDNRLRFTIARTNLGRARNQFDPLTYADALARIYSQLLNRNSGDKALFSPATGD